MRYLGVLLYDADRVHEATIKNEKDLYEKQLDIFLNPFDEEVIEQAEKDGISYEWIRRLKIHQCINWQLNIN